MKNLWILCAFAVTALVSNHAFAGTAAAVPAKKVQEVTPGANPPAAQQQTAAVVAEADKEDDDLIIIDDEDEDGEIADASAPAAAQKR